MSEAAAPLLLTLEVAVSSTLLALLCGVGAARLLSRRAFPGRELLDALLTLPLVLPPTVLGYYLIVVVGRRGLLGRFLWDAFGVTQEADRKSTRLNSSH